jgi:hypothetical protein
VNVFLPLVTPWKKKEKKAKVLDALFSLSVSIWTIFSRNKISSSLCYCADTRLFSEKDARRPKKLMLRYTHTHVKMTFKKSQFLFLKKAKRKIQFDGLSSPCIHPLLSTF